MGTNKMSRGMWKAAVCGWMLWRAVAGHAAEFSVGRVDIRFADEGWKEVPLPDATQAYGGEKSGALEVQAKLFVRAESVREAPVLVLVSTNSAGMGGGRGGYMSYSPNCKSDDRNYREGNEGFRASFAQCLTVMPRYNGASVIKALAPQLEGELLTEGAKLPRADGTAAADALPKDVPPAHVAWGRQLKDAVKSSVYSLSGRLDMPPLQVVAPPPPQQPAVADGG